MKTFFDRYSKKPFLHNVAVVASGTALAQVITMAFAPVITRLYGPEAFGLLGTFLALVAILSPIAALTYPIAIVLPKEDNEAKGIAKLSMVIASSIAGLLLVGIFLFGNWFAEKLQLEDVQSFLLLLPLVIILAAWLQVNQQWLIRKQLFKIKAKVAVYQSLIVNSIKSGLGFFAPLGAALILISVTGKLLHAFLLHLGLRQTENSLTNQAETQNKTNLTLIAKKYYDFPIYRAPQALVNALSQGLPVLLLATLFGPAQAGFYTLGKKILQIPSNLIGNAIKSVFYPKIAEASNKKQKLAPYIIKATLGMGAVGFLPFFIIVLFGPSIFEFVFGADWFVGGHYAKWLAVWSFFGFINRPSMAAIPVVRIQGFFLVYEIISLLARAASLYLGFLYFNDDLIAVMLFSLVGVLLNLSLIIITLIKVNKTDSAFEISKSL